MPIHGDDLTIAQKKQMSDTVAIEDQMQNKNFSEMQKNVNKLMIDKLI